MDREQQEDLHTMPPEEQLAAMGLTPEPEAEPATGPTGQEADLPDLPTDQQLTAMGLASQPEAEGAAATTGRVEPELEAYEAERAKAENPSTTRGGRKPRKTK
jgi:hypothetical protein